MRGLGAVRAAVVALAGVGLVWGAGQVDGRVDAARPEDKPPAAAVSLGSQALTRSELICPGPDRPGVPGTSADTQSVQVLSTTVPQTLLPRGATREANGSVVGERLPASGGSAYGAPSARGIVASGSVSGAGSVDLIGSGSLAPGLAGLQVADDSTPTARGLALAPCTGTAATSYLIAGGAEPGRLERLVLSNPSANPVSARVSVLGTGSSQQILVPGRSRKVTLLGAVNDTATAPVVQVASSGGGALAVAMADMAYDGTTPRGSEIVTPTAVPSRSAVIPAVFAVGGPVQVRVGVPGNEDAVVRVQVLGGDDTIPDAVATIDASSSGTMSVPDLPQGRYSLKVTADVPVVAAAESTTAATGFTGAAETMWMNATLPIETLAGAPIPPIAGGSATLQLTALDHAQKVPVTTTAPSGVATSRLVAVDADSVVQVPLAGGASVWVGATGHPVHAALVVNSRDAQGTRVSGIPLTPVPVSAKVVDAHEGSLD